MGTEVVPSGTPDLGFLAFRLNSMYAKLSCVGICLIVWQSLFTTMRAATRTTESRIIRAIKTKVVARRIQLQGQTLVSVLPSEWDISEVKEKHLRLLLHWNNEFCSTFSFSRKREENRERKAKIHSYTSIICTLQPFTNWLHCYTFSPAVQFDESTSNIG